MEKVPPKTRYKWVGFRESATDGDLPSLRESIGKLDDRLRIRLAAYLRTGVCVMEVEEEGFDLMDASVALPPVSFLSDGEWVWQNDVAHYVETYRAAVPAEFVAKAIDAVQVDRSRVDANEVENWIFHHFFR